jgi:hypothetical protein
MEMKDRFVSWDYHSFTVSVGEYFCFPCLNLFMHQCLLLTIGPVWFRSSSTLANNKSCYLFSFYPCSHSFFHPFLDIFILLHPGLDWVPSLFHSLCPAFHPSSHYILHCLCFCHETHYHPCTTTTLCYTTLAFPLLLCYPCHGFGPGFTFRVAHEGWSTHSTITIPLPLPFHPITLWTHVYNWRMDIGHCVVMSNWIS